MLHTILLWDTRYNMIRITYSKSRRRYFDVEIFLRFSTLFRRRKFDAFSMSNRKCPLGMVHKPQLRSWSTRDKWKGPSSFWSGQTKNLVSDAFLSDRFCVNGLPNILDFANKFWSRVARTLFCQIYHNGTLQLLHTLVAT